MSSDIQRSLNIIIKNNISNRKNCPELCMHDSSWLLMYKLSISSWNCIVAQCVFCWSPVVLRTRENGCSCFDSGESSKINKDNLNIVTGKDEKFAMFSSILSFVLNFPQLCFFDLFLDDKWTSPQRSSGQDSHCWGLQFSPRRELRSHKARARRKKD